MLTSAADISEITPHAPDRVTVALLSDTHYWPHGGEMRGSDGSLQVLDATETILATLAEELDTVRPDLIVHLGDMTCGGGSYTMTEQEFTAALAHVTQVLRVRSAPAFALPGNHDCIPGGSDWSIFEGLWGLKSGQGRTVDTPFARLILLNAQGHTPAQIAEAHPSDPVYGWVHGEELARLDAALASAGDLPVLVFVHQLLRPWSGPQPWRAFYEVQNAADVLDVMARYGNVRAVIQGHAHRLDVHSARVGAAETAFVVVPSLIEYPLAWMRLDVDATALRMQLRSLPLPALLELTRTSGAGQAWRRGQASWQELSVPLQPA